MLSLPSRRVGALAASLIVAVALLAGASQASAASQIGDAYYHGSGGVGCSDFGGTYIQSDSTDNSYAAPFDGVITSWGSRGDWSVVTFKVARLGAGSSFTVIASDGPRTHGVYGTLETHAVRMPVRQGDVIGAYRPVAPGYCPWGSGTVGIRAGDVPAGTSTSFDESTAGLQVPIEATIERDADGDGYGDETQDGCPTNASTHGSCPVPDRIPPNTTITKGPKKKTTSKSATFEFSSSEPGSAFQCSLDGEEFRGCTSPDKIRVKGRGTHHFLVRARDAAGNLDASEASWSWKLKKKKRKH